MTAFIGPVGQPLANPTPVWSWSVGAWQDGKPSHELVSISNRSLSIKLNDISTASFAVNGRHRDAGHLVGQELIADLWISRSGTNLARYRLTGLSDAIDETSNVVTCTASSYEQLLDRRLLLIEAPGSQWYHDNMGGRNYVDTQLGTVIANLIQYAQGQLGDQPRINGNLGITGTDAFPPTTFISEPLMLSGGSSVWSGIKSIINRSDGPDFWIDEKLVAHLTSPHAGIDRGTTLAFPGNISKASGTTDQVTYMNTIYMSGGTIPNSSFPLPPPILTVPDIATRPEGRWETALSDPALTSVFTLNPAAQQYIDRYGDRVHTSWSITLSPTANWSPALLWPGDLVTLVIKDGYRDVLETVRCMELNIALDQNDVPTVTTTLGVVLPGDASALAFLGAKLNAVTRQLSQIKQAL